MAVFKINKTKDYTIMSNTHLREKEMSLKAKGLLSLMLSLPEDWDYSISGLITLSKDGKDSVSNSLIELENFGYLIRTQEKDEDGKFIGYRYDIYEIPTTENPYAEKPITANPTQINTNITSTNKPKKETYRKKDEFVPPTFEEVQDYATEKGRSDLANKFYDYYSLSNWVDTNNRPVKNWKNKFNMWLVKDEGKPQRTSAKQTAHDKSMDILTRLYYQYKEEEDNDGT